MSKLGSLGDWKFRLKSTFGSSGAFGFRVLPGHAARRRLWPLVTALALGMGCSDSASEERTQTSRAALSSSVLAFESLGDWSGPAGKLSLSDVHVEGQRSLLATTGGAWTDVLSVPVGSIDGVPSAVSFKFRVPQAPASWETIQITFDSQSKNLNWASFTANQKTLVSLGAQTNEWQTASFPLGSMGAI